MFGETGNWRRLYAAAILAGAGSGLLVVLGVLPAVPPQLTAWLRSTENRSLVWLAPIAGGALVGLALAAAAHFGVTWQLRRQPKPDADRESPG